MDVETQTILVTGGTGFVGSHVVDELLAVGHRVRCSVRKTSRTRWLEGKNVERVEVDLTDGDLTSAVADVDAVAHCAGLTRGSKRELWSVNHEATRRLMVACLGSSSRPRFVFCSSQAAAGPSAPERPREEDDAPAPTSEYGRSKLAAERELLQQSDGLSVVVLRPVAVYGPRDEDTLPFFKIAARGLMVVPGMRPRFLQMVHARDVASAVRLALESPRASGRTYFVGHPERLTWSRIAEAMGGALGRRPLQLRLPSAVFRALGTAAELLGSGRRAGQLDRRRARDMSERDWSCRVDRVREELGWSPEFDVEEGLRNTAEWYRETGWM